MKKMFVTLLAVSGVTLFAGLEKKIEKYAPLDKDFSVYVQDGKEENCAHFQRRTGARTPDFKLYQLNKPRFYDGGLMLEPGGFGKNGWCSMNLLSAKADPFDKSKGNAKVTQGYTKDAFSFSGSVTLKKVNLGVTNKYLSTNHVFSFYAKGKGDLKFAPVKVMKSGKKVPLPVQNIKLTNNWKRYFVFFDCGDHKKAGADYVTAFTADFAGKNAAIDAPMLETPAFYACVMTPTSYISRGGHRAGDECSFPIIEPENGEEGAISFFVKPLGNTAHFPLIYIGKGWNIELGVNYHRAGKYKHFRINNFRSLKNRNSGDFDLKAGKKYHILFNYTKTNCTLYVDGKAVITAATKKAAPFKFDKLFIGNSNCTTANGVFSKVTVFSKALTPAEVKQAMAPNFPKLPLK